MTVIYLGIRMRTAKMSDKDYGFRHQRKRDTKYIEDYSSSIAKGMIALGFVTMTGLNLAQ